MKTNRKTILVLVFCVLILVTTFSIIGSSTQTQSQVSGFIGYALINTTDGSLVKVIDIKYNNEGRETNVVPGLLKKHAIEGGYDASTLEERYVTEQDKEVLSRSSKPQMMSTDNYYINVLQAPSVTSLEDDYPVGGIVLYTDNLLYYKAQDGWHYMMNGSLR